MPNKALQATPNGAVSSANADGAFWLGVPELWRWADGSTVAHSPSNLA
jgi:hypothetical protein